MNTISFWTEEENLDCIKFPSRAAELVQDLRKRGVKDSEILMLSRTYGYDVEKWKEYLNILADNGHFNDSKDDVLMTEQILWSLWTTLKDENLIKDFGDRLRELDWFIKNFKERGVLKNSTADSFLEYLLMRSIRKEKSFKDLAFSLFSRVYVYWGGVAKSFRDAVWAYIKAALPDSDLFGEVSMNIYNTKKNPIKSCWTKQKRNWSHTLITS